MKRYLILLLISLTLLPLYSVDDVKKNDDTYVIDSEYNPTAAKIISINKRQCYCIYSKRFCRFKLPYRLIVYRQYRCKGINLLRGSGST